MVETVAATSAYLDTYFRDRLGQPSVPWDKIFLPPQRCLILAGAKSSAANVTCTPLLSDRSVLFDYPTFNPVSLSVSAALVCCSHRVCSLA